MLCTGTKSELAHMCAQWLPDPCRLVGPQCSARGQNQKWPTCGHSDYLTYHKLSEAVINCQKLS